MNKTNDERSVQPLFLSFIIIFLLPFSLTLPESYGDDVSNEARKWLINTGPTTDSKEMAFIKSDLVVTGTITDTENTQKKGITQYLVHINDYLKNTENQEIQLDVSKNVPLALTLIGDNASVTFKKGDLVYLFLNKDPEDGELVISSASHKIPYSCKNTQNPNSPIFSIMSVDNLLTSEFKAEHFASYPVNEEIIFNYHALNTEIEPVILNVEFNVTISETDDFENAYHFSKEIKLAPCNGYQLLEWSFTPTIIGEYSYTLDASGPNESLSKKAFNVYTLEEFEKIKQSEINYNTAAQKKSFIFEIMGLKQAYELNELTDVGIQVFGLGCGNNFIAISKNNNVIYQDGIKNNNYDLRPDACGMAHGIPINNPDAETNIAITEPGQYRISSWFEQFNSTLIYSEKPFVIFDKEETSPFKQSKLGIQPEEIKCKEGLQRVIKLSNVNPACIKPESYAKLILRGWALVPKYIPGEMPKGIEIPDDVDIKEFERIMKENKTPFIADEDGKIKLDGKDALDICGAVRLPCPTNPVFPGKMLDENNILVTISGTSNFDVKLNQTHVCVTSKTETTCEIR